MLPVTVTQGFHGKTDPGEDLLVLVCVRKEVLEHTFLLPYWNVQQSPYLGC